MASRKKQKSLATTELAMQFMKIGSNAFGGWSTTYVLLEKEFLENRKLISEQQLQAAAASGQSLPGPAQVIITAQIAYYLGNIKGAIIGTICYLLPSVLITVLFSFFYFHYFRETDFSTKTIGLQAAVGGILIGNAYKIARRHASTPRLWLIVAIAAMLAFVLNVPTVVIIFGAAILGALIGIYRTREKKNA